MCRTFQRKLAILCIDLPFKIHTTVINPFARVYNREREKKNNLLASLSAQAHVNKCVRRNRGRFSLFSRAKKKPIQFHFIQTTLYTNTHPKHHERKREATKEEVKLKIIYVFESSVHALYEYISQHTSLWVKKKSRSIFIYHLNNNKNHRKCNRANRFIASRTKHRLYHYEWDKTK